MKLNTLSCLFLSAFIFFQGSLLAQNVGVNTDGSLPETGVMLDVKSNAPKATTVAVKTIFQLKSSDASTSELKLRMGFKPDATAGNRYGFIDFPDYTTGTPTYRNLALQPSGGNVGVGTISPLSLFHTAGILTVGSGATAGTVGNVQITTGGASPISNRLTFGTDGSGWKFAVAKNQGGTVSELMTIQDNGNVGIGITAAAEKFHVVGNARISTLAGAGTRMVQADLNGTLVPLAAGTSSQVLLGTGAWGSIPGASGNYIQNQIALAQATSNFWISGTGRANKLLVDGASLAAGNIQFTAATPYITASSYIIMPGGLYVSAGTLYATNQIQARGGVHNDVGAYLTIAGGTSGFTSFTGAIGVNGVTSSTYALEVNGKIKTTSVNESSDIRWKKDISTLEDALAKVKGLRGVNYKWRTDEFKDKEFGNGLQIGLIAQEVEKIFPQLVDTDKEGFKSIEYSKIVAVLIEAIKEQQRQFDAQQNKIEDLQKTVDELVRMSRRDGFPDSFGVKTSSSGTTAEKK